MNKKDCLSLFNIKIFNEHLSKPDQRIIVDTIIQTHKKQTSRQDQLTYLLKHARFKQMCLIMQGYRESPTLNISELNRKDRKRFNEMNDKYHILDDSGFINNSAFRIYNQKFQSFEQQFEHYKDLNLTSINNIVMLDQNMDELTLHWETLENEWIDAGGDRSVEEYGTKIIELDNGMTWFDLEKSGCRIEADAMRHCGNGSEFKTNERLYSLRTPCPFNEGNWIPRVTLLIKDVKNGIVTEIKGVGNSKPSEKYHDAIVAMVMRDEVKKLQGGGYMSYNNFKLSDLPDEKKLNVFKNKPSLFDSYETWKIKGKQFDKTILDIFKNEAPDEYWVKKSFDFNENEPRFIIDYGDNLQEFASAFELEQMECYAKEIDDIFTDSEFGNYRDDTSGIEEALDKLMKDPSQARQRNLLIAYLNDKYSEEIKEEEIDVEDGGDILKLVDIVDDSALENAFSRAYDDGCRYGAELELYSAIDSATNDYSSIHESAKLEREHVNSEWRLTISIQGYFEIIDKIESETDDYHEIDNVYAHRDNVKEHIIEEAEMSDLDVPYYGFSGYDERCAYETLCSQINEELFEYKYLLDKNEAFQNKANPSVIKQNLLSKNNNGSELGL